MRKLMKRLNQPTPRFFKKLRTAGLCLLAAGTAALASPVALPAFILKLAGYLTLAGVVMSGVSQTAIKNEAA